MNSSLHPRNSYLTLPNLISFVRMAMIPLLMVLMGRQSPVGTPHYKVGLAYLITALFLLSAISDLVDGYYARRLGLVSVFGKFLDPLADKLILLAVLIMLIPQGEIPAWLVVVFLTREVAITALRGMAASEGVIIAADRWGKKKTALQNVALTCFLLPPQLLGLNSRKIGWFFLIAALVMSIASGINYTVKFFRDSSGGITPPHDPPHNDMHHSI